jgi:hypothetical protein
VFHTILIISINRIIQLFFFSEDAVFSVRQGRFDIWFQRVNNTSYLNPQGENCQENLASMNTLIH